MNAQAHDMPALRLSADRGYIGGGNIAGILGVSPYKSPLDEFLTITGQADDIDPEREAFFKRRKALEPFVTEVFEQRTGIRVARRNVRYTHPVHTFIKAEIDFEPGDENGEIKTVHPLAARDWGDAGTDDIPVYVTAQAMHGLMVTGRAAAWIHALIGLDDDRIYRIERDNALIADIEAREVEFWRAYVMRGVAPDASTVADVARLYPRDSGRTVEADDAAEADLERLKAITPLAKEAEEIKDRLRLYMRDATTLTVAGKPAATWKAQTARRFDQSAFAAAHPDLFEQFKTTTTTRVMRIK